MDEIVGKTDEDMNWHVDNNAYRLDELDVLHKGKTIENVVGECIIQGELHHITCYKWPLYQNGELIGLMGVFVDVDAMYRDLHQKLPSPFEDTITGLHNRQGFLGDLTRYQEAYTMDKQDYALILLESRFDKHIQDSYDSSFLRVLVREEADILRRHTGKGAAISRIQNATFAILRRETSHKESEELARELQYRLQAIHEVAGNPSPSPTVTASSTPTNRLSTTSPIPASATSTASRWNGCAIRTEKIWRSQVKIRIAR